MRVYFFRDYRNVIPIRLEDVFVGIILERIGVIPNKTLNNKVENLLPPYKTRARSKIYYPTTKLAIHFSYFYDFIPSVHEAFLKYRDKVMKLTMILSFDKTKRVMLTLVNKNRTRTSFHLNASLAVTWCSFENREFLLKLKINKRSGHKILFSKPLFFDNFAKDLKVLKEAGYN